MLGISLGGGSSIDTCKVANLYASKPDAEFLDFVNAPIGRGVPITHKLSPLIAIPTTAGTSTETTGVAVFYSQQTQSKTGISLLQILFHLLQSTFIKALKH